MPAKMMERLIQAAVIILVAAVLVLLVCASSFSGDTTLVYGGF